MKTWSRVFLVIGIIIAILGHVAWGASHMSASNKVGVLVAIIPGWSLLLMGWIGMTAQWLAGQLGDQKGTGRGHAPAADAASPGPPSSDPSTQRS